MRARPLRSRWRPPRRAGRAARRARDDGSAAVELLPVTVVFFALVAMIVFLGRLTVGQAHVEAAARTAARTISMDRDPGAAAAPGGRAERDAREMVDAGSSMCADMVFVPDVDLPTADAPGVVEVEIRCEVDVSSALLIGVPGTRTTTATAEETIDQYRGDS